MSRQRPWRTHQRALANLIAAIATGEATAVTDILAAVTPGGGKSLLPVIVTARTAADALRKALLSCSGGDQDRRR